MKETHSPINIVLDALCGPLILRMLPASVHRTSWTNLTTLQIQKPVRPGKKLEFQPQRHWRVNTRVKSMKNYTTFHLPPWDLHIDPLPQFLSQWTCRWQVTCAETRQQQLQRLPDLQRFSRQTVTMNRRARSATSPNPVLSVYSRRRAAGDTVQTWLASQHNTSLTFIGPCIIVIVDE